MKKIALLAVLSFSAAAAFADPVGPGHGPSNVTYANTASGAVNSQSIANAASSGNGTAFSSTQSGAFATYGQTNTFVNAPAGAQGGTAAVTGFTQANDYVTSQSATTGSGVASSSSWNSAAANSQSFENTRLPGYTGAASGEANSYVLGAASTKSTGDKFQGVTQIQGNSAMNTSLYSASDSGILTPGTVSVNGVSVPVNTVQTETSATAQSDSTRVTHTVYSSGAVNNVGNGGNWIVDNGNAAAVAN